MFSFLVHHDSPKPVLMFWYMCSLHGCLYERGAVCDLSTVHLLFSSVNCSSWSPKVCVCGQKKTLVLVVVVWPELYTGPRVYSSFNWPYSWHTNNRHAFKFKNLGEYRFSNICKLFPVFHDYSMNICKHFEEIILDKHTVYCREISGVLPFRRTTHQFHGNMFTTPEVKHTSGVLCICLRFHVTLSDFLPF